MSADPDRALVEQAVAWHLRLNDADERGWKEFAEWLNADPAHNEVYEVVADADARMSTVLERATFPGGDEQDGSSELSDGASGLEYDVGAEAVSRRHWRWGALAASIAVAGVFAVQMLPDRHAPYSVETSAGETRSVSLADGSEILLNGSSTIVLDKDDTRLVELVRGEARFAVKHDDSDPFTVVVGEQRLVDLGTIFNVVRTDRQLRVGVAEGAVRFEGLTRTVELRAGDSLSADNRGRIEISQGAVASIGSWTGGKLIYDRAPLDQVTDDLSRSIGVSIELPRGMRSRSFSGVIQMDGDRNAVRARLAELIGEKIVADGTRWSIEAR